MPQPPWPRVGPSLPSLSSAATPTPLPTEPSSPEHHATGPGHADYTYQMKYGIGASSGGGRASARETVGRVAAGAIAEKWLNVEYKMNIVSWVSAVGQISIPAAAASSFESSPPTRADVERCGTVTLLPSGGYSDCDFKLYDDAGEPSGGIGDQAEVADKGVRLPTRCPHPPTAVKMAARIKQIKDMGDSIGGVVTTVVTGVPVGLGEPCFDKTEALLAHAMMSLPATKGFEMGDGFGCASMRGSVHNDRFVKSVVVKEAEEARTLLQTSTNHAGGTLGGITSGMPLIFRVAIKPVSSIGLQQDSLSFDGKPHVMEVKGRHDACVLPRAVPLTEAMTSLTLADLVLRQQARGARCLTAEP